jgi:hypothetical protein
METSPIQHQAGLFGVVATGALKVFRQVLEDGGRKAYERG